MTLSSDHARSAISMHSGDFCHHAYRLRSKHASGTASQQREAPVIFAQDGTAIEAGHTYVAPPDHHMLVETNAIQLTRSPKVHYTRPAADPHLGC
jgi:hypothetical protein